MSIYSWDLPPIAPAPPAPGASSSSASSRTVLAGLLDQEIDPTTLDFIDTPDGEWAETPDSRSIVLCQLELKLGRSYSTPGDGTRIGEQLAAGDPVTGAFVEADVRRALALLTAEGVISEVDVQYLDDRGVQLVDETGRPLFVLAYKDLATGSPVDLVYRPMEG